MIHVTKATRLLVGEVVDADGRAFLVLVDVDPKKVLCGTLVQRAGARRDGVAKSGGIELRVACKRCGGARANDLSGEHRCLADRISTPPPPPVPRFDGDVVRPSNA